MILRPLLFIVPCASLVVSGCDSNEAHTVPVFEDRASSPEIIGDGMELRSHRMIAGRDEVRRALVGLGAELRSSNAQILRGLEYYELDRSRLDDLVDVTCEPTPWNVRWVGQSFAWQNMMPSRVPVESEQAWLALLGRTWSTMMEDGPVVYIETMPMIASEQATDAEGRFDLNREEDLRMESVLLPGRCVVLLGGIGVPYIEEGVLEESVQGSPETLGGLLMRSQNEPAAEGRDLMVFIPHFTPGRLRPLRPRMQSESLGGPDT